MPYLGFPSRNGVTKLRRKDRQKWSCSLKMVERNIDTIANHNDFYGILNTIARYIRNAIGFVLVIYKISLLRPLATIRSVTSLTSLEPYLFPNKKATQAKYE